MERVSEFRLGEEWSMVWGKGNGFMHNVVTRPKPNVLRIVSEERERGWNFDSVMTFSEAGMINTRHFLTEDIKTVKYYQKLNVEGVERKEPE